MEWGAGRDLAWRGLFKHWAHRGFHKHCGSGRRTGVPPPQLPGLMHSCRVPARAHALPSLPCTGANTHVHCVHTVSACVCCALRTGFSLFLLPPTSRQNHHQAGVGSKQGAPFPSHPRWANSLEGIACSSSMWQHYLIPALDSGKVSGHFRDKIGTLLLLAWVEVKCHGLTSA